MRTATNRHRHLRAVAALAFSIALGAGHGATEAAVIFGNSGLSGGLRWDAAPRTIDGFERSLDGGLRFSLEGGSYEAFRDSFTWRDGTPSVSDFTQAVDNAFGAWTATDPATGLGTDLRFVRDFDTPVDTTVEDNVRFGAEIDLFARDLGDSGTRGFSFFHAKGDEVTLTSGTTDYPGTLPISGADITLNANSGADYTLDLFRRLLTHEIGHAIGLGDVEGDINPNQFIDDNYDDSTSTTAEETLTNSWAQLVDVDDPANSPLSLFSVPEDDPGVDTEGVNILMESRGLGIGAGNPVTDLLPLRNDDFGGRQFLYPNAIPLPSTAALAGLGALGLLGFGRRRAIARKN